MTDEEPKGTPEPTKKTRKRKPKITVTTEPSLTIYNDRVTVNGAYTPKDLALMMYLIHIGEYAKLMISGLKERLAASEFSKEDQDRFLQEFSDTYQSILDSEKIIKNQFSSKPVVRPLDVFKQ